MLRKEYSKMSRLNGEVYEVENDNLIYDAKHPVDAENIIFTNNDSATGKLERGMLLDEASGVYTIHKANGNASVIVAEDAEFASDEETVVVPCYVSGTFRTSAIKATAAALTDVTKITLQNKGIYLK